ncbi:MAG: HTH domain-containing protein [Candidatus Cloacimonetes bacterium]|nr:HTH domain-containing protein [Candidatus Cloacimonadota bacterium]
MNYEDIRQMLLEIEEIKLRAQLRAVREALKAIKAPVSYENSKRNSQTDYVYRLLKEAKKPLHVRVIIEECRNKYGIELVRESIVSALLKKINNKDRFIRTAPNTFGLIEFQELYGRDES